MSLPILFKDEHLLIVNKPAGLLSVPGKGPEKYDSVASRAVDMYPDVKVVHRLDCLTSGVMLMAFGKPAQVELSRQFHDRETTKEYIAVVEGRVCECEGTIDIPIRLDVDNRPWQIVDHVQGKRAITHWQRLSVADDRTRLLLQPVTGRSHQLRVHCQQIGHPIIGDSLYGGELALNQERMLLHAKSLGFYHPVTKQKMQITAECEF